MAFPLGNLPTSGEKLALATDPTAYTTPGAGEPYVTNSDPGLGITGFTAPIITTLGANTNITSTSDVGILTINHTFTKYGQYFLFANILMDVGNYLGDFQFYDESGALIIFLSAFDGSQPRFAWTNSSGNVCKSVIFLYGFGVYSRGQNKTFTLTCRSNNGGGQVVPVLAGTNMTLVV